METENYSIKAEVILPMVQKYFERILPAQWSMLAAGTIDSATQVILADMCTDITQKLCADTIRVIIPEFKQRIQSAEKKKIKLEVEGGLSTAFASALSVPEEWSKSSQKLDSLFKREISQRVNHTLSTATSADSQLVPLIYIPGTFTKIEVLAKMVLLASGALKVYLSKKAIYTKCFRPCWRQKSRQEPPCDSKSGNVCIFNWEETTEAVMNILRKWADSEDRSLSHRTNQELTKTAAGIVETIINDLHYPDLLEEGHSPSSAPHFNHGLIKDQLCDFFEACVSPDSSNDSSRKRNFLNFCQKKFDTLTFELQTVRCRCMRKRIEASRSETPAPDNLLSFQGIQSGLENVFHKVAVPQGGFNIDVDELRQEADKFSLDLADKIYQYMTKNRTTVQSDAVWRHISNPLILEVEEEKPENIQVLHKLVEDTATKFVQQLLLWLEMEPAKRGKHADEVYGCLNDIDTLITGTAVPQPKKEADSADTRPKSLTSRMLNVCPPSMLEEKVPKETRISQSPLETDSAQARTPPSGAIRVAWPSPLRSPSVQERSLHGDTLASQPKSRASGDTPGRSTSALEDMVTSLVAVLVVRLLTKLQKKHNKVVLSRDTLPIIQRLSKKVLQDPRLCAITEVDFDSVSKVMKAVIKELLPELDRTHQMPEAFLSEQPSFDNALLKLLMVNLEALKAPQQGRTRKLFSATRRVFSWTFCRRSSSYKMEIRANDETVSEISV
ncbi:uncharacterized protein LOC144001504 [Festucalex cinctus]